MPTPLYSNAKKHLDHLPFTNYHSHAFTLIEVMVTTAIILIVSGFSFSVITSSQRSNRDTLRKTDLNNIQSTLQQYYADQSYFPSIAANGLTPGNPLTNCTGASAGCTVSKTYLNKIPGDPSSSSSYYYTKLPAGCDNSTVNNRCYNYCLYTILENAPTFSSPSTACATPPTGYNYVVTQP